MPVLGENLHSIKECALTSLMRPISMDRNANFHIKGERGPRGYKGHAHSNISECDVTGRRRRSVGSKEMYKYVIYIQLEPFLFSFAPCIPYTKRTVPLRRSISLLSDIQNFKASSLLTLQ